MSSASRKSAQQPRFSPPVHQHRTWRHLQRAAVAAHRELLTVTQSNFCALMTPAASIAVWILQHAPHLVQRSGLRILVAQATEFEALDSGRWFQFIPWLLGRPAMTVDVALVGSVLLNDDVSDAPETPDSPGATLDFRLRSHAWTTVKHLAPAQLHQDTVRSWLEGGDDDAMPDLCAVFSASLSRNFDTLLAEDGLVPLLRNRVPLALFSSSEAGQLIDVFTLKAAGLEPTDPECWPNPWALPRPNAERSSVYGKMGWAAEFDMVPATITPDLVAMNELADALHYSELGPVEDGPDGILSLGESMKTAPRDSEAPAADVGSVLLRLPQGVAVDAGNGHVYQLQDVTALLLDGVPAVPRSALNGFPGDDDLLRRVMWAVGVHREFVAPFVRAVDDALKSQFSALDSKS